MMRQHRFNMFRPFPFQYITIPRAFCALLLLVLFLHVAPLAAVAAPADQPAPAPSALEGMLEVKQRELTLLVNAEQGIAESVDERLENAREEYRAVRQDFEEALLAQGLSLSSPIEERAISRHLGGLVNRLSRTRSSLRDIGSQAAVRLDRLSAVNTRNDFSAQSVLSEEAQDFVTSYVKQITQMRRRLDGQQERAEKQLKQVQSLLGKIEAKRQEKDEGLADRWKEYFFRNKEPLFSVDLWRQPGSVPLWFSVRTAALRHELAQLNDRAFSATLLTLFMFGLVAAAGAPLVRPSLQRPDVPGRYLTRERKAGVLAALGLALVVADMRVFSGAVPTLSVFSWFVLGYGVLLWSNTIRKIADPEYNRISKSPLAWLFLVAGAMLVTEMPPKLVVPLWTCTVGVFLWFMIRRQRRNPARGAVPLNAWFWVGMVMILCAMAGFGRFSAFICMVWFVGYVAYGTSRALMLVIHRRLDSLPAEGSYVMLKGALLGVASPVIWFGSASLGIYWLYQFMGEGILRSVGELTISWKGFSLRFASVVALALLFYVTRACAHLAKGALDRMARQWPRGQRGTVLSLKTMATYGLWGIYGLVALNVLGVSLTSLTVVAGGLSVGIGFGMQTIFNNFVSGLILLFGRSIQQGDIIQVGDLWCTVRTINIRATVVETFENASLIIPNSELVTTQVTNWTKNNQTIRRDLVVGVAYGSDTELTRSTLLAVAEAHPNVLRRPQPAVIFSNFGASSLDFILRVWINDIDVSLSTMSDLRFAVDDAFRKANLEIAFPQMDLHIRSAEGLRDVRRETGGDAQRDERAGTGVPEVSPALLDDSDGDSED